MKDSLKRYLEYRDSEDDFQSNLRLYFKWDDEKYRFYINLLTEVINDYKEENLIPIPIYFFFTNAIDRIAGTISHPDFRSNLTTEEVGLLEQREKELLKMKEAFLTGNFYQ